MALGLSHNVQFNGDRGPEVGAFGEDMVRYGDGAAMVVNGAFEARCAPESTHCSNMDCWSAVRKTSTVNESLEVVGGGR